MSRVRILLGDVRARLADLPADSVHCVVTSPPYWGLRDYGVGGQLGLEPTPAAHVAAMVEVFRAVRRVLRPDGVCWVNYGDSYAGAVNGRSAADTKAAGRDDRTFRDKPFSTVSPGWKSGAGLKPKDLCMVPFRFALAMQEDGWWLRSVLPWIKRNGMPESITDRPASAVEYVFLFARSERYRYDAAAVKRVTAPASIARLSQDVDSQAGSARANGGAKTNGPMKAVGTVAMKDGADSDGAFRRHNGANASSTLIARQRARGRSTCGRHTLGEALPVAQQRERGLTPRHEGGINHTTLDEFPRGERNFRNNDLFFESLGDDGQGPHGLITDAGGAPLALDVAPRPFAEAHFATFPPKLVAPLIKAGCPAGGTVLDPFGGAGTTGLVASGLGRAAILIELNPDYAELARRRIGMFAAIEPPRRGGSSEIPPGPAHRCDAPVTAGCGAARDGAAPRSLPVELAAADAAERPPAAADFSGRRP